MAHIVCENCKGNGQGVTAKGNAYICPDCNGTGTIYALPKSITVIDDGRGGFECECRNTQDDDGATACDFDGNAVEPTPDEWPSDIYRCDRCGLIFHNDGTVLKKVDLPSVRMLPCHARQARIEELKRIIEGQRRNITTGATLKRDDHGAVVIEMATCGTCGMTWNDALCGSWTPAPSGRCPFEYVHAEIAELRSLSR